MATQQGALAKALLPSASSTPIQGEEKTPPTPKRSPQDSKTAEKENEKWKPLPPMAIDLSIAEKMKELTEKRRYSTSLARRLVGASTDFTDGIKKVEEYFKSSPLSEASSESGTYILVDPRSYIGPEPIDFNAFIRGVFYIGEGKKLRCADHFASEDLKNPSIIKDAKIESIWKEGKTPTAVVCTQGETKEISGYKEAMMMMAYGNRNLSIEMCSIEEYEQGKLVNKRSEEYKSKNEDQTSWEQYGVDLLVKAWETYKSHDKQRNDELPMACAVRIMWSTNPKEVQRCKETTMDTCLVCNAYLFPKHKRCYLHWIPNKKSYRCSGSRKPPFPNLIVEEDEMKFGACNICKLACKLEPLKSPKKVDESCPLVVVKHVDSQRSCDGSRMTLEEMKIARKVKDKMDRASAGVGALTGAMGNLDSRLE